MNTSFIQPENSNKTVLVSDNKIARLEPDDIKTESTDSQSESSRDDIDVASPNSTEETSVVEGEQPSLATRTSKDNKNSENSCIKMTLETMYQMGVDFGAWCKLICKDAEFSSIYRCLPSTEVPPGGILIPVEVTSVRNANFHSIFEVRLVSDVDIFNALVLHVKLLSDETSFSGDLKTLEKEMENLLYSREKDDSCEEKFAMVTDSTQIEIDLTCGNYSSPNQTARIEMENINSFGGYELLLSSLKSEVIDPIINKTVEVKSRVFGVMIHGSSGIGKSFLSKCLIGELGVFEDDILREIKLPSNSKSGQVTIYVLDDLHFLFGVQSKLKVLDDESVQNPIQRLRTFFDQLHKLTGDVLVIGITPDIELIDSSLRRVGYFEYEYEINPPSQNCRYDIVRKICQRCFANFVFDNDDLLSLSFEAHGYIAADLLHVLKYATFDASSNEVTNCNLKSALKKVKPSAMKEIVLDIPPVKWSDIGGQSDLKAKLRQCIEWPVKNPEKFAKFGIQPPRGILLYGPPGCSKTMVAKALANETGLNFLSVKGPEIYDKYVGQSEKAIRKLFQRAKQAAPVIIFFDEIDAIAPARGNSSNNSVSDRVLTQLLTEMDGVEKLENVVIVAATNRPDIIDKALLRPGRIDKLFYVELPDSDTRQKIIEIKLRKTPPLKIANGSRDSFLKELLLKTEGFSGAEVCALCDEAAMNALRRSMSYENAEVEDFISEDDFCEALKFVLPQTTKQSLKRYEEFRQQAER
ncbi:ATPase family gene 2 protein homolog A-like [Convolutriloba macropyga]|uniref:ATPase family gene 2 protein homolog A-like n=1 Tax=Convolutriloba macropyga TaxID=536237 RepID=UPI003F526F3A